MSLAITYFSGSFSVLLLVLVSAQKERNRGVTRKGEQGE
jgi:hypothetical protein